MTDGLKAIPFDSAGKIIFVKGTAFQAVRNCSEMNPALAAEGNGILFSVQ